MMLMAAIAYPVVGGILHLFNPELSDSIGHRLIISGVILVFYTLTYTSDWMLKNLNIIIIVLYYLLTVDIMYMCVNNNFHEVYKLGLLLIVFASAVVISNELEMLLHAVFVLIWLVLSYFIAGVTLQSEIIFSVVLVLTMVLSYIILKVKIHLYQRLILSDQIVNNADAFILLFNSLGELVFANPTLEKTLGYKTKDLLGDGWWDIRQQNPENEYTSKERVKAIINGAELSAYDHRNAVKTKHADVIWIDWQVSKLDDQLILIGNDATPEVLYEKKQAELSIVAQSSKDMIVIADKNDQITWVNEAFTEITGYTYREALGRVPADLIRSPNANPVTEQLLVEKVKNKESFEFEILNVDKSGQEFWMSIRTRIILDAAGEIDKFITLGNDITKTKETTERLRLHAERSDIMHKLDKVMLASRSTKEIVDYSLNAILQLVAACDRVSYTSYDAHKKLGFIVKDISREKVHFHKVRERKLEDFFGVDELIKGNSFYIPSIEEKEVLLPIDEMLLKKGLKSYMSFPLLNGGKLVGSLNMAAESTYPFTDSDRWIVEEVIHEFAMAIQQRAMQETIKKNNSKLSRSNSQLKLVNDELSQFAHVVSHDLKAPLRAIITLADFIAIDHEKGLGEAGIAQLDMLKGRTKRMGNLIEGILQYSQVEIEKSSSTPVQTDEVVTHVLNALAPDQQFTINAQPNLPVVTADFVRVQQVFQNVLSNAIKYCNQEKGEITLGFSDAEDFWEFSVKDNGDGIDKRHHDRIFKIFQTLRPRDEMENTGIGLTITKKVIETYGGSIWLESEKGQGTTFFFTLPKN